MRARAEAERWLKAAGEDLAWARHALQGGFAAPGCFHAQQAGEKAVKAVHYARGARIVLGHSVRGLIEKIEPPVEALAALRDGAAALDLLYVPARYPNGLTEGTPGDAFTARQAEEAIATAARILEAATAAVGAG